MIYDKIYKEVDKMNNIVDQLKKIDHLNVQRNVLLKNYTSFKVGGPADIFVAPKNESNLINLFKAINKYKVPYFILGQGSNIIVSDQGYNGLIIYTGKLNKITIKNQTVKAEAGITLRKIAETAVEHSLTGIEFASGIPGSLGGAIYMNAGSYGGQMKDVIKTVTSITNQGKKIILDNKELNLSYRSSIFQKCKYFIFKTELELKKGNKNEIKEKINELDHKRKSKQPLEYPSAGSSFKRPKGHYTGPLIEKAKMKGYQIGGAQVSKKHAGFIINKGDASANDIVRLIKKVQKEVYKTSKVRLKPEPKFIGEFKNLTD